MKLSRILLLAWCLCLPMCVISGNYSQRGEDGREYGVTASAHYSWPEVIGGKSIVKVLK